jgi:hypothetical protein
MNAFLAQIDIGRIINPLEVMFTSAVGFGEHHFHLG